MRDLVKPAIVLFIALTLITGVAYPLLVTGIAQVGFPSQANGSLIDSDGKPSAATGAVAGSRLIGQPFDNAGYFWSRLSATGPYPYNAASSSGSNLGPINPALDKTVRDRIGQLQKADPTATLPVPVDLVTASGSGLDPEISPAAAQYQAQRVAAARGIELERVEALIKQNTQGRTLGLLGEARVNVLELNLALDKLAGHLQIMEKQAHE